MSEYNSAINVGILGTSEFALRAMAPAINNCVGLKLKAIASRAIEKAREASKKLNCIGICGYHHVVEDPEIQAIYIALPTSLHMEWGLKAMEVGKHLLVEKSLACNAEEASEMVTLAKSKNLVLHENFLFLRHSQTAWVKKQIASGMIGQFRSLRMAFTIPALAGNNFRYSRELGGGALLDLGAYMVKAISEFLGDEAKLLIAIIEDSISKKVDIGGAAMFVGTEGVLAQVTWGFDCSYQCSWDFLGNHGRIHCSRAFTPPPGLKPSVTIERNGQHEYIELPADNHYINQWQHFLSMIQNDNERTCEYSRIMHQAKCLSELRKCALKIQIK